MRSLTSLIKVILRIIEAGARVLASVRQCKKPLSAVVEESGDTLYEIGFDGSIVECRW